MNFIKEEMIEQHIGAYMGPSKVTDWATNENLLEQYNKLQSGPGRETY